MLRIFAKCQNSSREQDCASIPRQKEYTETASQYGSASHGNSKKDPLPRDENLRRIRQVGRKQWKEESGYHRRSLAETAVFRFKIIFGNTLSTRTIERQITEARIKAAALNRMTQLGMPDSYRVA